MANTPTTLLAIALVFANVASAQEFRADIDGAQGVPPTGSSGKGLGCFTLDAGNSTLHYEVSYSGLGSAEIATHIHGPAPIGSNGAGLFTFPSGAIKIGTFELLTET